MCTVKLAGGLNPVQIEIEVDRILNMLKRYKNVVYRLRPIGILFPAFLEITPQHWTIC